MTTLVICACCYMIGASPDSPNVLIVTVDALRQDYVGAYGNEMGLTPNINRLASRSLVFWDVVPQSSWTHPSIGSLFTGLYPEQHGAEGTQDALRSDVATMAEVFAEHGYDTWGVINNGFVDAHFGYNRGFTRYTNTMQWPEDTRCVSMVLDELRMSGTPWFGYVHMLGPHGPHADNAEWKRSLEQYRDALPPEAFAYAADTCQADADVGMILGGFPDDTIVIIMADHGEDLTAKDCGLGWAGHGKNLRECVLKIPFILHLPYAHVRREVTDTLQMVDVLPTLTQYLFDSTPSGIAGRSFHSILDGGSVEPQPALASLHSEKSPHLVCAKLGQYKYVYDVAHQHGLWYDLREPETIGTRRKPEGFAPLDCAVAWSLLN